MFEMTKSDRRSRSWQREKCQPLSRTSGGYDGGSFVQEISLATTSRSDVLTSENEVQQQQQQSEETVQRLATDEEIRTLPHTMARIPVTTWLLMFTGSATAFAKYGVTVPLHLPGALGLGESKATIITSLFSLFIFLTPLPMGILSDARLGHLKTMNISLAFLVLGYFVLVITALPVSLRNGAGFGGLIVAMVLLGIGQGGISAVMFVLIGDQVLDTEPIVIQKNPDQLVVTDRKMSIQFIFNAYFWAGNLASLSIIGTTFMERTSFWCAFLMPTVVLAVSIIPLFFWGSRITPSPPRKNVVPQALRVSLIAIRHGFRLSAAEPCHRPKDNVPWDADFVGAMRRGLKVCQVLIAFVIFWLCYNQMFNNIISQAGQMELAGISNDTMVFINIAAIVILSPVIQSISNLLRHRRIRFGPIRRITVGFVFIAMAMGYAAGLQKLIYSRGPCYSRPLECPAAYQHGHRRPNEVNVWIQAPIHILLGAGEILGYVSVTEYAYSEAPPNMKAVVQAISQFTVALGFALGVALGPVSKNPLLVALYAILAGVMGLSAAIFWIVFRKYDDSYEETSGNWKKNEQSDA